MVAGTIRWLLSEVLGDNADRLSVRQWGVATIFCDCLSELFGRGVVLYADKA